MTDVPTPVALWGVLSRQARHGAGQHTSGVYNRINWPVLRYVATYRRRMRPHVLVKIAQPRAFHRRGAHTAADAAFLVLVLVIVRAERLELGAVVGRSRLGLCRWKSSSSRAEVFSPRAACCWRSRLTSS
ncbi:hypothetical protein FHU36_003963 [Nonomuraea muscovyensis]|uniref:Uncharacterized protein n=1 Tax=Nonomuraea muscovyensis TaxID=1124761 RepID=A0A7X0EXB3_9ACTN|nr:hypothetical protein [Nonomuraea muscovyensis]MBB6347418.1 hypothetical protein [Nonomuraea muscovyensis]